MRIYFAGIESYYKSHKFDVDLSQSYCLESFFYTKELVKTKEAKDIIIDSGAFSMMRGKKAKDLDDYVTQYAEFIKNNNIKHFLELDIENITGIGYVEEVRRFLENTVNRPCMPVWHVRRGLDYLKKMCKDYDYIAMGGLFDFRDYNKLIPLIRYAHIHKTKVHGLGFTKTAILDKFHFDSVDSTTWINGGKFGKVQKFDESKGKIVTQKKPENKRLKHYKLTNDHNLAEWVKFGKWAERNL